MQKGVRSPKTEHAGTNGTFKAILSLKTEHTGTVEPTQSVGGQRLASKKRSMPGHF